MSHTACTVSSMPGPEGHRSNDRLVDIATGVLSANPASTMHEIALAAGVSRATLHRRFPSREALMIAIAEIAIFEMRRVTDNVAARGLTGRAALDALIELAIPLAPRFGFIATEASVENDLCLAVTIDSFLSIWESWCVEGQRRGELRVDVPAKWMISALHGLIVACYEGVRRGEIAERDSVRLVHRTFFSGLAEADSTPLAATSRSI